MRIIASQIDCMPLLPPALIALYISASSTLSFKPSLRSLRASLLKISTIVFTNNLGFLEITLPIATGLLSVQLI